MPRFEGNPAPGSSPSFYLTPAWLAALATAEPDYHTAAEPESRATITEIEDDAAEEAFRAGASLPSPVEMDTPRANSRGLAGLRGLRAPIGSEFLPQTPAIYGIPGPTSHIGQPRPAPPPAAPAVIHLPVNFELEKNKAAAAYYHNPYSAFKAEMAEAKETEMVQSRIDKLARKQERANKRQEREARRTARRLQKEMAEAGLRDERRKNKGKHRLEREDIDPVIEDSLSNSEGSDDTARGGRRSRSRSRSRSRPKSKSKSKGKSKDRQKGKEHTRHAGFTPWERDPSRETEDYFGYRPDYQEYHEAPGSQARQSADFEYGAASFPPQRMPSYPPQRPYYGTSPPEPLPFDAETYGRSGPSYSAPVQLRSSASHPLATSGRTATPYIRNVRRDVPRQTTSEPPETARRHTRPAAPCTPPAQTSRPSTPTKQISGIALMKPRPRPHNPYIIELIFPNKVYYYLTLAQVEHDAPNAFTQVLHDLKPKLRAGKLVHVPVRDRNPLTWGIIMDHLNGVDILPLSSSHCIMLNGKSEPNIEAYNILQEEVTFYGLIRLSRKIDLIVKKLQSAERGSGDYEIEELPLEPFSLLDAESMSSINVEHIQTILAQVPPRQSPVVGLPLMRAVVIDAAINFAGEMRHHADGTAPEAILAYRISIPPSPLSQAFGNLLHWNRPTSEEAFSLEGELTRTEAAKVVFDIEHIDHQAIFPERPGLVQLHARTTRQSTLREICDGLNPILRNELYPWNETLLRAFTIFPFRRGSPVQRAMPFDFEDEIRNATAIYVNLPVALVTIDFSFPKSRRDRKQYNFAIRQVNAKTREVMREEGYQTASSVAGSR